MQLPDESLLFSDTGFRFSFHSVRARTEGGIKAAQSRIIRRTYDCARNALTFVSRIRPTSVAAQRKDYDSPKGV
jgi:hypothetical protein